ncbi:MAG: cytochrome c maturation protein CcmE [Chloroflexi bacterium]|nr:cytochrome c maturation protein CcmE [Chloroflexota bacterium]
MSAARASVLGGRRVLAICALAVAVIVGFVAVQGLQGATVYYLTPTEALSRPVTPGATVRLGGQVLTGTLRYTPGTRDLRFTIGDGVTQVRVVGAGAPPGLLREGAGAVVEGTFATDGTFHATQVLAKHDEVYQAPSPGATPQHRSSP